MVPGKPQMLIEVRLKNTGSKPIDTTVYNHHFTTLSPGNEAIELVAPFNLTNVRPMPSDVIKFEGPRMSYLRAIKGQEQVASDLTGFGSAASDNDFRITNTKTGFGVRLRADLPIARLAVVVDPQHLEPGALYGDSVEAGRGKALDPHAGLLRPRRRGMIRTGAVLLVTLLSSTAMAQPVQPPPPRSYPVEQALAAAPFITLTNGRITAKVTPPDLERGFFRGTRFDQAGVVTSLKLDGKEFYGPWFSRTAPEVLDYTYTVDGLVAGPTAPPPARSRNSRSSASTMPNRAAPSSRSASACCGGLTTSPTTNIGITRSRTGASAACATPKIASPSPRRSPTDDGLCL